MAGDIPNTAIDYGLGGSGSYFTRSEGDNVLPQIDMDYINTLSKTDQNAAPGSTSNSDYYPALSKDVIKGYYTGSVLGSMPLTAETMAIPFAAIAQQQQQQSLYDEAKNKLYTDALQYEYSDLKDQIKNNLWGTKQFDLYEADRQKYVDAAGSELTGTIAYKNSNDYKLLKRKISDYTTKFNDSFDLASNIILAYEGQGDVSTSEKTTAKGDVTTTSDKTSKYPKYYVSESLYNAAKKWMYGTTKETATLDDIDELNKLTSELRMGAGVEKTIAPYVEAWSSSITNDVVKNIGATTTSRDVYDYNEVKGLTESEIEKRLKDSKTGDYNNAFNAIYNNTWGALPAASRPTKDDVYEKIKQLVTSESTKLFYQVDKFDPSGIYLSHALDNKEKTTSVIPSIDKNININIATNTGTQKLSIPAKNWTEFKKYDTIAYNSYMSYDIGTGKFIAKPVGDKTGVITGIGSVSPDGKTSYDVAKIYNEESGTTEFVPLKDVQQQVSQYLDDNKINIDSKFDLSLYPDLTGYQIEESTTVAPSTSTGIDLSKFDNTK